MDTKSASGLAIAGFVILLVSFPIPIYGLYIGGIGLGLVAIGAFFGERTFTVITVVLSVVKIWFLSPTFAILTRDASDSRMTVLMIAIVAHAVPLVAMYFGSKKKVTQNNGNKSEHHKTGMPRND